jgi:predicted 3-demethylubiquinone-9 3-methyltransferase (glyoxalase superfamily)
MQKISPFLWFDTQAEEAAEFYVSIFPNSKIGNVARYDEAGSKATGQAVGAAMVVAFDLDGQSFSALNGGLMFKFNESVSFVIDCETQEEVDYYWAKLSDGGSQGQCGWLKDKYGLSWQVVPKALGELMNDPNPAKAGRVMQAMLGMRKLDIATLRAAHKG